METQPLVLIGLPGSGKSSAGARLAELVARPHFSIDAMIEIEAGMTIPEIFEREGAGHFRSLESEVFARVLDTEPRAVIDGGGGLILASANRERLARNAVTVWLDAPDEVLAERVGAAADRPLLSGGEASSPLDRIRQLRRDRLGVYTSAADAIVPTAGLEPDAVADRVLAASARAVDRGRDRILVERVELEGGRDYEIHVGRGAIGLLARLVPDRSRRVAVITQPGIGVEVESGREQEVFEVEDGERAKRLDVVGDLCSRLARWGFTRADTIVSVGGGVVSDLAGFVAASYHRGVPVIHVSTTLLGQIDAAIGGKCGVNLPEGKNLVGAFWQPEAVVCDVDTLDSLPPREFRSGMGELAKYHFLGGGRLDEVELVERVAASARIKAEVVSGDEREGGRRAILNYGHTLAHALETSAGYDIRHGEAVAVGLVYAAELAHRLGRIDRTRVDEHRRVVAAYGLDVTPPDGLDPEETIALFARDKKAVTGVTFVLDGPDGVEPMRVDDTDVLRDALDALSSDG